MRDQTGLDTLVLWPAERPTLRAQLSRYWCPLKPKLRVP